MQWVQIITEFVRAIAWPVFGLILLWRFKKPLDNAISAIGRGRPIKRLKAGGFEVEWEELDKSEEYMSEGFSSAEDGRRVGEYVEDLYELAQSFPSAAILLAFKRVELKLYEKADRENITVPRGAPLGRLMQIMEKHLPKRVIVPLHSLRKIRNQVTHLENEADVTPARAIQYLLLAGEVLTGLNDLPDQDAAVA